MESLEEFKRKILSQINRYQNGHVILLPFIDENNSLILEELLKSNKVNYYKFGGFKNSDRNRYLLSQYDYLDDDFKINVYKIIYNKKFNEINHRNVLGSLMSLGIKRESIGDIVIKENKDIYIALTDEISKYVLNEFNYIGKASVELEKTNEIIENVINYESKEYILSSLRVDCVISSIYNISRSESQDKIREGLILVNHQVNFNHSLILKEEDIISLRGKGKYKIGLISGLTRKDRIKIIIEKRI